MRTETFTNKEPYPEGVYEVYLGGQVIKLTQTYIKTKDASGVVKDQLIREGDVILYEGEGEDTLIELLKKESLT